VPTPLVKIESRGHKLVTKYQGVTQI